MKYHMIAFLMGFLLDQLLGDPYFLPHPVRLIGKLISGTEQRLRRETPGMIQIKAEGSSGRVQPWC